MYDENGEFVPTISEKQRSDVERCASIMANAFKDEPQLLSDVLTGMTKGFQHTNLDHLSDFVNWSKSNIIEYSQRQVDYESVSVAHAMSVFLVNNLDIPVP